MLTCNRHSHCLPVAVVGLALVLIDCSKQWHRLQNSLLYLESHGPCLNINLLLAGQRLPLKVAMQRCLDVARGLQELHSIGIIMGDLKPVSSLVSLENLA